MIYCGKRGSGKTVKLLKLADALIDEGITPVILSTTGASLQCLKENAESLKLNTSKMIFLSVADISNKKDSLSFLRDSKNYRIFIDELDFFITELLGARAVKFHATLCTTGTKMVYRSDWDKEYQEQDD